MYEASKAVMRRLHDSRFVTRYFVGDGIDIGAGPDPLGRYAEQFSLMRSCREWDLADGDAQFLATIPDNSLDFVHSSHCLEHMRDPREALHHWLRVLKPGGHLVVTIPDEDLYEQGVFPSTFNGDHKWTFTMQKARSWSARSVNLMSLLGEFADHAQTIKLEQLDATFHFRQPRFDQTSTPIGECALEFILRKLPAEELARGGRIPEFVAQAMPILQPAAPVRQPVSPVPEPITKKQEKDGVESFVDTFSLTTELKRYCWLFMFAAAAIVIAFNFNRYFGAGLINDHISISRVIVEVGGSMFLGLVVWWFWAKVKRISSVLREGS